MDITIFLAQLWGPVILALGLGVFVSREHYLKVYRNLERETLAIIVFVMLSIAAGIAQISVHNVWNTLPEVLISLFGWLLLVKGVIFAVVPKLADKAGDWAVSSSSIITAAGAVMLLIGAYLSWFGYLV